MQKNVEVVREMLRSELYDSVELLCGLQLSALKEEDGLYHEYSELLADALFGKTHIRRSLTYYRKALACYSTSLGQVRNKDQQQPWKGQTVNDSKEVSLIVKICKCHLELNDASAAVKEMETIPTKLRTIDINMLLGKLYRAANLKRMAITAYKAVLCLQPYAIEAIQWLLSLGADAAEIEAIVAGAGPSDATGVVHAWLKQLMTALICIKNCDHTQFMVQYAVLSERFPQNAWLKAKLAGSLLQADCAEEAMQVYRQIRIADPSFTEGMELFGLALYDSGHARELNVLANELLALDPQRPCGWLSAALYCQLKGESEKAKTLADKAIDLDPLPSCFNIKGRILLAEGQSNDLAVIAFFQANSLEKSLLSFAGLVQAHLTLNKIKEATSNAKDAITLLPKSAAAFTLVGQCLSRTTNGAMESLKAYSRALKLDPGNIKAALLMSDTLVSQGKMHESLLCLRGVLERRQQSSQLRISFARVLINLGNYSEAIDQLHAAIAQAPADSAEAVAEMERVEALLNAAEQEQATKCNRSGGKYGVEDDSDI